MSNVSVESLFGGIRQKHIGAERKKLTEKWSRTGLLKGLDETMRENMAQLLENQAAQIIREGANAIGNGGASMTSTGNINGFSNIAFPIVRRVFGALVANELVSIQPMSLPSGLIFYLDYTYGSNVGGEAGLQLDPTSTAETYQRGQSLYNNPAGKGVRSGSLGAGGMYDLVNVGYSRVHTGSHSLSGSSLDIGAWTGTGEVWAAGGVVRTEDDLSGSNVRFISFDPQLSVDLAESKVNFCFVHLDVASMAALIPAGDFLSAEQIAVTKFATNNGAIEWGEAYQSGKGVFNLRRHNKRGNWNGSTFTPDPLNGSHIQLVVRLTAPAGAVPAMATAASWFSMAIADSLQAGDSVGSTLTIPSFESDFGTAPSPTIPEIDIKIESIPITATTRKLRARWSPELAQDLNAYHSMDAEVELTSILSQQVALEIDREILNDLVVQANGANMYWSRAPGRFVNKLTGVGVNLANSLAIGPNFTGTVREWYETLVETIIDVGNTIHRKTLRGSANFIVVGPDVATILESSVCYKAKLTIDSQGQVSSPFSIGCEQIGTLSNRFTVYKDPYFPRNKILVGYKGGSYLETGYVYAPYVPLIVTPTIFAPEDFTPRKGVMTRYGKKMIRTDFYGTVTVTDLNII
jgi:hypothetical protein